MTYKSFQRVKYYTFKKLLSFKGKGCNLIKRCFQVLLPGESRCFGIGGDGMINIITHSIPNPVRTFHPGGPFQKKGSIRISNYQRASKLQPRKIKISS